MKKAKGKGKGEDKRLDFSEAHESPAVESRNHALRLLDALKCCTDVPCTEEAEEADLRCTPCLETELQEINDRLSTVQRKIDDTGKQFSDNTPLTNIKKAITKVKNDIKAIDIRIGVVSNTLLQLKLKERTKVIEDGKALEILDGEYEIEM